MLRVLVVTGGHRFEPEPFFAMFDALPDVVWAHAPHPGAGRWFDAARDGAWDAIAFYDMPGLAFRDGALPDLVEPPTEVVEGLRALLDDGQGMVFLHHAIAGWPAWDEYAEMLGGRFQYRAASLGGAEWPGSGYRHDVVHQVTVVDADHPVTQGIPDAFELEDELYLMPTLEDDVVPLLRSDARFTTDEFFSAGLAVQGQRDTNVGWKHPPGSNLVGWAKGVGRSPIVYLQPGHGPATYASPTYRQLLGNAIRFVASDDAHSWARDLAAVRSPAARR